MDDTLCLILNIQEYLGKLENGEAMGGRVNSHVCKNYIFFLSLKSKLWSLPLKREKWTLVTFPLLMSLLVIINTPHPDGWYFSTKHVFVHLFIIELYVL